MSNLRKLHQEIVENGDYCEHDYVIESSKHCLELLNKLEKQLGYIVYFEIEDTVMQALTELETMGFITGWYAHAAMGNKITPPDKEGVA